MESWATKTITLCLLFVSSLFFGLAPIYIVKYLQRNKVSRSESTRAQIRFFLSLLNCFAGGVFLGTTLLHLMPEVKEDIQDMLSQSGIETHFALSEFIIACGFFLIMLVENIIMVLQHHQHGRSRFESTESLVCCESEEQEKVSIRSSHKEVRSYGAVGDQGSNNPIYLSKGNDEEPLLSGIKFSNNDSNMAEAFQNQVTSERKIDNTSQGFDSEVPTSHHSHHQHHHHNHHQIIEVSADQNEQLSNTEEGCRGPSTCAPVKVEKGDCVHVIHPSHHEHHHMEPEQLASLRSFLLLLALSLHTVFEGIAIGLQPTNEDVWNLFIAIVIHKCVIVFSMGIQFAEALQTFKRAVIFIIFFAMMSPLGIAIGIGVFEVEGTNSVSSSVSATLQAIATGTFLYVTFFEVLHKEVGQDHNLLKVLFVILGFGAMVLLNLFNGEPEH